MGGQVRPKMWVMDSRVWRDRGEVNPQDSSASPVPDQRDDSRPCSLEYRRAPSDRLAG